MPIAPVSEGGCDSRCADWWLPIACVATWPNSVLLGRLCTVEWAMIHQGDIEELA